VKPTISDLPHNRSSALFDGKGGFSERFEESIDLWSTALLNDDGIVQPIKADNTHISSKIIVKQKGIFAGRLLIDRICNYWTPQLQLKWNFTDGDTVSNEDILVEIRGDKTQLLKIERPILNILGRLSGIATTTHRWSTKIEIPIASTRKTTWGLLDKWAVHVGGALTHRLDRNDALMLKENDLAAQFPELDVNDRIKFGLENIDIGNSGAFIILEVRSKEEAIVAAKTWNIIQKNKSLTIMLDNIEVTECDEIIQQISKLNLHCNIYFEASGGITLENLDNWKNSLVNVISTSSIHRGTQPLDISLLFEEA
tara:strand:- start:1843 stop:2778 length:936 start_codon:yes stop_codon:yes gene_type:complete